MTEPGREWLPGFFELGTASKPGVCASCSKEWVIEFPWACGPPIGMKIRSSGAYDHEAGRQRSLVLWMK